jgi:hypothetical protein
MKKILIALFFLSFSAALFPGVCEGCNAAYNYLNNVTHEFDKFNIFERNKW